MCAENGLCVLSIEGFIVPEIGTQCETGECLIPSEVVLEDNNGGMLLIDKRPRTTPTTALSNTPY